jgi:ubiquinone/menaquinone biosynthesis C-methylase UbiE
VIEKEKTRDFWEQVANQAQSVDESVAGMLTDSDPYISRLRQEGEEKHFMQAFNIKSNIRLLEVGTGGGRWVFFLSNKVKSLVGIDFSQKMIELAKLALEKRKISNATFEVAELTEYNSSEKFDIIYFSGMLQYLTDDEVIDTIRHASTLLTPTGYFISRDSVQGKKRVILDTEHSVIYRTVDEYESLFQQEGFKLTYNEMSYPDTRFSTFASKLYRLPVMSFGMARAVQKCLLSINSLLGDPRWLMRAHHIEALETVGTRDHRFFRYERTLA